jgi:transposase
MVQQHNRYFRRSRISEGKFRQFLRCFALDLTAVQAAQVSGISERSATVLYQRIRRRIAEACERESPLTGVIEADESYFGARRVRGRRGRGARGKTIVFGLLKRQGRVYTSVVPDCRRATLQAIIRGKVAPESVLHTDEWRAYHGLVDVGYAKHFRVKHGKNEFANRTSHINGIESFWSYAKRRLSKFNGIPNHTFVFHLKECEWRFNRRNQDVYRELLKLLRENPL